MDAIAAAHEVTVRTLRNWMKLVPDELPAPVGRPPLSEEVVAAARAAVLLELERQGWKAGEEPVWRGLERRFSRSLVRRCLRELKADRKKRARVVRERERLSVEVRYRDAVWSIDATHLGRDAWGRAVEGEVLREGASGRTIGLSIGPKSTARDVLRLLEQTARERGGAPLVLVTDNAGAYTAKLVQEWLRAHQVVHLKSLPRTPQHNAAAEHGIGELVYDSEVRELPGILRQETALAALLHSLQRLDHGRLRATRAWRTAVQADDETPSWNVVAERGRFYATACCAMKQAVIHSTGGRAARRAERNAILLSLQDFKLIRWTRGGAPRTDVVAEDVL